MIGFAIFVTAVITSLSILVNEYESTVRAALGKTYNEVNAQFLDADVEEMAKCILKSDKLSSCVEWMDLDKLAASISKEGSKSIKTSLYKLAQSNIDKCPPAFPISINSPLLSRRFDSTFKKRHFSNVAQGAIRNLLVCGGLSGMVLSGTLIATSALAVAATGTDAFSVVGIVVGTLVFLPSSAVVVGTIST